MNISPMITNQSVCGNSKAYKTQAQIITIHTDAQVIHNTWPSWRSKTTVTSKTKQHTSHATLLQPKCQMAANCQKYHICRPINDQVQIQCPS